MHKNTKSHLARIAMSEFPYSVRYGEGREDSVVEDGGPEVMQTGFGAESDMI